MTDLIDKIGIAFATLNNREIATGIWLVGVGFFVSFVATRNAEILQSLGGALRAIIHYKILIVFGFLAAYIVAVCWFLSMFNFWKVDQFFPTFFWYLFSGLAAHSGAITKTASDGGYFSNLFRKNFQAILVFEFVVTAYSFHLLAELLIVPFVTIIVGLSVVSENDSKYAPVHKILQIMISAFGFILLIYSFAQIHYNPEGLFNNATIRNFFLPIILGTSSFPSNLSHILRYSL